MLLATITSLALVLGNGANPRKTPVPVSMTRADAHADRYEETPSFDAQAEQRLLELANAERVRTGGSPLELDQSLTVAARAHAEAMAEQGTLSHQLPGEAPLQQRLAESPLHLDLAGENVALDADIDQAHDGLMHSPPHRQNILRAGYNVVGIAVARWGGHIYVVEDFGHSLPTVSADQAENAVAAAIAQVRKESNLPQLKRVQMETVRRAACSMADRDRLDSKAIANMGTLHYVLTYTNMQPDVLPTNAGKVLDDRQLHSFAVGSCFAHTPGYPNGTYWVTVVFY